MTEATTEATTEITTEVTTEISSEGCRSSTRFYSKLLNNSEYYSANALTFRMRLNFLIVQCKVRAVF